MSYELLSVSSELLKGSIGVWVSVKLYVGLSGYQNNLVGSVGLMKS